MVKLHLAFLACTSLGASFDSDGDEAALLQIAIKKTTMSDETPMSDEKTTMSDEKTTMSDKKTTMSDEKTTMSQERETCLTPSFQEGQRGFCLVPWWCQDPEWCGEAWRCDGPTSLDYVGGCGAGGGRIFPKNNEFFDSVPSRCFWALDHPFIHMAHHRAHIFAKEPTSCQHPWHGYDANTWEDMPAGEVEGGPEEFTTVLVGRCHEQGYDYTVEDCQSNPQPCCWQAIQPTFRGLNVGGQWSDRSRYRGATPFGSGSLPGYCANPGPGVGSNFGGGGIHCFNNINDNEWGNSHSWIPGAPYRGQHFVGIRFADPKWITGIVMARDKWGQFQDRIGGTYTLQFTQEPDADHDTEESKWIDLIKIRRVSHEARSYDWPHIKGDNDAPSGLVLATAVRLVVSDPSACIDELRVFEYYMD